MIPAEAERLLKARIRVTPHMVVAAKAIILDAAPPHGVHGADMVWEVLQRNGFSARQVPSLKLDADETAATSVEAAGGYLSWRLAAAEALWGLIRSGLFIQTDHQFDNSASSPSVPWTHMGNSTSFTFPELQIPVPARVCRAPSAAHAENQFLADADLYLNHLGVSSLHPDVRSSFEDAIRCLRAELFTASLAMLGRASEGAWLELGGALVDKVPTAASSKVAKESAVLNDRMAGTMRKVYAVTTIYGHKDIFGDLYKSTNVKPTDLAAASIWSDAVRGARNTIHFGVVPATPNTYEKVATLLIAAPAYMQALYRVKDAADAMPTPP